LGLEEANLGKRSYCLASREKQSLQRMIVNQERIIFPWENCDEVEFRRDE
jgi:hypothetical protein